MSGVRKIVTTAAGLAVILGASTRIIAQEKGDKKEPAAQLTGQLIDTRCYIKMGVTDGDHQECAVKCMQDGIPAGVLTDKGDLYTILAPAMGFAEYANKTVRLTGKVDDKQHVVVPTKIEIKKGADWVEGKLPKSMM